MQRADAEQITELGVEENETGEQIGATLSTPPKQASR
jgi:hypothetical protein